jgi:hypothetical protein
MDMSRRVAPSGRIWITILSVILFGSAGCAQWLSDFSPSDYWPSKDTWEKLSPSNLLYDLQPSQLNKLNRGPGMPSDVYYSVSDPLIDPPPKHCPDGAAIVEPVEATKTF